MQRHGAQRARRDRRGAVVRQIEVVRARARRHWRRERRHGRGDVGEDAAPRRVVLRRELVRLEIARVRLIAQEQAVGEEIATGVDRGAVHHRQRDATREEGARGLRGDADVAAVDGDAVEERHAARRIDGEAADLRLGAERGDGHAHCALRRPGVTRPATARKGRQRAQNKAAAHDASSEHRKPPAGFETVRTAAPQRRQLTDPTDDWGTPVGDASKHGIHQTTGDGTT